MVKRLAHGGTHKPGPVRPGSGYGRRPGRPGPHAAIALAARLHRDWWLGATDLVPAAVTRVPVEEAGQPA